MPGLLIALVQISEDFSPRTGDGDIYQTLIHVNKKGRPFRACLAFQILILLLFQFSHFGFGHFGFVGHIET